MKRLIELLAVSAGSGILVGAGIRWADRQREGHADIRSETQQPPFERLSLRMEAIERRLDTWTERPGEADRREPRTPGHSLAALEERLLRRTEERIDALGRSIEERFESRLDPLEAELSVQRSSVAELREYSLRTERSLQKLLEGVDKLVAVQSSPQKGGTHEDDDGETEDPGNGKDSGPRQALNLGRPLTR